MLDKSYQKVVMEVKIKTCTPIWTGGIEAGKCDRIHETSILGSLRWWMEVLVRGMGGVVCDPTEQKCSYDSKKPNNGLCKVCEVFGATGWKRRFRLEVEDKKNTSTIQLKDEYSKVHLTAIKGEFTLKIRRLTPNFDPYIIGGLIQFIADYSALGARTQMGFGVIKIEGNRINTQPLYNYLRGISGDKIESDLPSLRNIFMGKIQPKNLNFDEKSIKHELRQMFNRNEENLDNKSSKPILKQDKNKNQLAENKNSDKDRKSKKKDDKKKIAAKVKISQPYKDEQRTVMRIWGWMAETVDVNSSDNYEIKDWREMESSRDFFTPNQKDAQEFLRSLLGLLEDM